MIDQPKPTSGSRRRQFASLGLLALALNAGCSASSGDDQKKVDAAPIPVKAVAAEKRTLRPSFKVIGSVSADPARMATLTAATTGLVEKLEVREGAC